MQRNVTFFVLLQFTFIITYLLKSCVSMLVVWRPAFAIICRKTCLIFKQFDDFECVCDCVLFLPGRLIQLSRFRIRRCFRCCLFKHENTVYLICDCITNIQLSIYIYTHHTALYLYICIHNVYHRWHYNKNTSHHIYYTQYHTQIHGHVKQTGSQYHSRKRRSQEKRFKLMRKWWNYQWTCKLYFKAFASVEFYIPQNGNKY